MNDQGHILLVEDEDHLRRGIAFNLDAEGYRVTALATGHDAAQRVLTDPADLVILDIMLPGMSGYDICKQLREKGVLVPILFLTARTLTEDRTRGFEAGGDQYLNKPFELDELLARVRSMLLLHRRRAGVGAATAESTTIRFGDAEVDLESHRVTVAGREDRLTSTEMKLFRYLTDNAGRVIPRKEILERVWNLPGYILTRAPDQVLLRLRKLFEQDPAQPKHFQTIRDVGIRFVPTPEAAPSQAERSDEPPSSTPVRETEPGAEGSV